MNIQKIVTELQRGNLVITPTDTIYGILADAMNESAIQKVYACKNRNKHKALILLVCNIEMLQEYTQNISDLEREIISKYLPGRLTILLHKNSKISAEITGGSDLVGIRIPDHQELVKIIKHIGNPIISTSANISGQKSISSPKELEPRLLRNIAYIEDGGSIDYEPSSLIKIEDNEIIVLREGNVARQIAQDYHTVRYF